MLFTSFIFPICLTILFLLYWGMPARIAKYQNLVLLLGGYIFYGWWGWQMLLTLVVISGFNFITAIKIGNLVSKMARKRLLALAILFDLLALVVFRQADFFTTMLASVLNPLGLGASITTLNLLVPVGISFYIFISISYLVDVYRRQVQPETNIVNGMLALSFFPVLVAGPVQRPTGLLPQLKQPRRFDYPLAIVGLKQIAWGLFMKTVVANNCSIFADRVFAQPNGLTSLTMVAGALLFTVQIYADFSGYSDIVIGIGKLLGIKIVRNFAFPYFAKDIAEFWKRWNISLTSFFRDYLFLPVAYWLSARLKKQQYGFISADMIIYISGIFVTWSLTGLWHGLKWNFLAWGLLHGTMLVIHHLLRKVRRQASLRLQPAGAIKGMQIPIYCVTMAIVVISMVFFRSNGIDKALQFLSGVFSCGIGKTAIMPELLVMIICLTTFFLEYLMRKREFPLQFGTRIAAPIRWSLVYLVILAVIFFGRGQEQFIYAQF